MKMLFLFLILASLSLTMDGLAQHAQKELKFKHIKANSQLSNSNIYVIFQDSKGFLWVGTNDGLNRFDGYDFKIYRNIENDSASLLKNEIQSIFEDSDGTLWVSTLNSGLHYYNRAADAFYRIPEFSHQHCQVLRIMEDFNHNLWIGGSLNSQAFVATRDHQTSKWKKFLLFPAVEGITSMLQYSENEFWLGSRLNGLFKWNNKTNELKQYQHDPSNPNSLPGNYIQDIVKDLFGNLWIGVRDGGLCKLDVANNKLEKFSSQSSAAKTTIPNNAITDLCTDNHYLWIATENGGLSKMDTRTEAVTNYLYKKADPNSIINNSIWSLHKDRQDRLWIGSYAKGLCVFDPLEDKISTPDLSLENELVNAVFKDSKGRMWIGTEDGLVLQDKSGTHYFYNDPKNGNSLGSNTVLCIIEDRKHRIWLGLWNGGINRFVESSKSFVRYVPDPTKKRSLTNPHVFSIAESSKTGELLLSTFGGLNILKDEKAGIFENNFQYPLVGDQYHITLLEDSKQNIWVGAYSGLSQYSLENNKVKRINIWNDTTKVSDHVNCIFEDHNGIIWIGSDGGLHKMVSQTKFINYTTKDGLPVNVVRGILEDSKGNLWLGTTKGLTVFNPVTKAIKTYDESDGLISNEIRRKSFFKAANGQLFIGGNGINTFFPDSIITNPNKPAVYITDLKIFNQSINHKTSDGILKEDITETKEFFLDHTHTFFSLHYVGINFTASYKNQYAYKLQGFNDDWVVVGSQRFATFTNLDPGTYTFKVKASNNDGLWNEEGASLIIHVLPPWWETWWFRTFSVLALACAVMLIYILRTRNIRRTNHTLKEMVNQKTKELQETNIALVQQEEEIKAKNKMLTAQSEELAAQNEELVQSQEEISSQRDLVSHQNENLELEVAKRTTELVEYNRQLEQFAFISAHNLRAPVARILGLGQLLDLVHNDPKEKESIYPKLVHTARELDGVVKDLNTILELKKNNDSFITDVDLNTEISMIRENMEREISLSQANITTNFTNVDSIRTVKPYLDSILLNLVGNAIKYRHPNRFPIIHIKTERIENEVCLSVADNGLGIDVTIFREKLFTLYSRFHLHVEGKGMGLYLVKTQMIAMGGRIEIESEVDKGTTFRAYFKS